MIASNVQRIGKATISRGPASAVLQRTLLTHEAFAAVGNAALSPALNELGQHQNRSSAPIPQFAIVNRSFASLATPPGHHQNRSSTPIPQFAVVNRSFASLATPPTADVKEPGTITRKLTALDMSVVRRIKAELMDADLNDDGQIDAEELKALLGKHNTFTNAEIEEISDVYYAAKHGSSVSIDDFIEAIDQAVAGVRKSEDEGQHFKSNGLGVGRCVTEFINTGKPHHGHYTAEELDVKLTHVEPVGIRDRLALNSVKAVRFLFDTATGWRNDNITTDKILHRVIYLETIAGVPGMVAAIIRHFRSLRTMERDGGYLQMFLEEANNERMHLLTFVGMKNPNTLFRLAVLGGQFGFGTAFLLAYIASPKFCHRFVGYIEEEACTTYTKIIDAIEEAPEGSELAKWKTERAPKIALAYWKLGENGTVLDLMYAVRADEAEHRDVNHLVSGISEGQVNPLYDPETKLNHMLRKYVNDIMKTN